MFDAFDFPDLFDFFSWQIFFLIIVICILRQYLKGAQFGGDEKAKNKIVVITGGNVGIGKQIVRELCYRGATVYVGTKDESRGEEARLELFKMGCGPDKVHFLKLDLSSFASIRHFAAEVAKRTNHIDLLINNAGVMTYQKFKTTEDNHEYHWQVNYLGHFLLTELLIPLLKSCPEEARIVNVSAQAHFAATLDLNTIDTKAGYEAREAYSRSKLALVMHVRYLSVLLRKQGICYTRLFRHTPLKTNVVLRYTLSPIAWFFLKTPKDGAQTPLFCALSKKLSGVSGKYFSECKEKQPLEFAMNMKNCQALWIYTKNACNCPVSADDELLRD